MNQNQNQNPRGVCSPAGGVLLRVYACCLRSLWLLCSAVPFVRASCCPGPPPRVCVSRVSSPAARRPLFPLCLPVVSRRSAVCSPADPPGPCFLGVIALPLVFLCHPAAAASAAPTSRTGAPPPRAPRAPHHQDETPPATPQHAGLQRVSKPATIRWDEIKPRHQAIRLHSISEPTATWTLPADRYHLLLPIQADAAITQTEGDPITAAPAHAIHIPPKTL